MVDQAEIHRMARSEYVEERKRAEKELKSNFAILEVKKYLEEAKSALEGSVSKKNLLEVVENLGNALKEAQRARDFNALKSDLNAYRRYCERACELFSTQQKRKSRVHRG